MEQQTQNIILKKILKAKNRKFKIKISIVTGLILLVSFILFATYATIQNLVVQKDNTTTDIVGGNKQLSPEVLKWQKEVEKYTKKYGIPQFTAYALAIMQVESGGKSPDLMQSSESAGLPVGTLKYEASIEQGIKHLSNIYEIAKQYGIENDIDGICQAYNFGTAYIHYLGKNKKTHSIDIAEQYSKDVVAKSLGNTSSKTYPYVNEVSIQYGKTYLYLNGGNFYYAALIKQYVGGSGTPANPSDFYEAMKNEMEKYIGWSYVWGGKSPQTGFDCSGLTSYLYKTCAGITINSYTVDQYNASVPVSLKDAKAGDLIFFKGTYGSPDFVSHVGIYVNETTMFDSNDSGVGYHNWQSAYWQAHNPEIRRVVR